MALHSLLRVLVMTDTSRPATHREIRAALGHGQGTRRVKISRGGIVYCKGVRFDSQKMAGDGYYGHSFVRDWTVSKHTGGIYLRGYWHA